MNRLDTQGESYINRLRHDRCSFYVRLLFSITGYDYGSHQKISAEEENNTSGYEEGEHGHNHYH